MASRGGQSLIEFYNRRPDCARSLGLKNTTQLQELPMFDGHCVASLALKPLEKRTSPGILFFAVQLVDILFPTRGGGILA